MSLHLDRKLTKNLAVLAAHPWRFFHFLSDTDTSKHIQLLNLEASEIPQPFGIFEKEKHVVTFRGLVHYQPIKWSNNQRFLNHVTINHHQPCLFNEILRLVIVDPSSKLSPPTRSWLAWLSFGRSTLRLQKNVNVARNSLRLYGIKMISQMVL